MFNHKIQDDFVFVYRNDSLPLDGGKYLVFGIGDAQRHGVDLIQSGYKHTATISASIWLERLLEKDADEVVDMVDKIDS